MLRPSVRPSVPAGYAVAPRAAGGGGRLGGCWPCPHKDTGKGHPRTADVSSLLLRRVYGTWTGSAARCTRGGRRRFWQPGRAQSRVPRPARWSLSNVTPRSCPLYGTAQVPAVCQHPVPPLYCGSMAIDFFSSRVNLDGLGLRRVFVHVWLRLSRDRRVPCWSPQPTHPPASLCAAAKLKGSQKTSLVKRLENSGVINQLLITGSAVYGGRCRAALPSPCSPGQPPQPRSLLRRPVRTWPWELVGTRLRLGAPMGAGWAGASLWARPVWGVPGDTPALEGSQGGGHSPSWCPPLSHLSPMGQSQEMGQGASIPSPVLPVPMAES